MQNITFFHKQCYFILLLTSPILTPQYNLFYGIQLRHNLYLFSFGIVAKDIKNFFISRQFFK